MKKKCLILILELSLLMVCFLSQNQNISSAQPLVRSSPLIADHTIVNVVRRDQIHTSIINLIKDRLFIAYGHTSHGSQITSGLSGLPAFKEHNGGIDGLYDYNEVDDWDQDFIDGELNIDDRFPSYMIDYHDLGNPNRTAWADSTRIYLNDPANARVNVVMWSWCGQVSSSSVSQIDLYLNLMTQLEMEFPQVHFVYMTGHTDGTGEEGNCHLRNEQIRIYCQLNNKILFDFADIESYDPDGNFYGDQYVTDSCNYDFNGDGYTNESGGYPRGGDRNWALDWQTSHVENTNWYDCSSAHSHPLNANMKAYATWWLFARLIGWGESNTNKNPPNPNTNTVSDDTSTTSSSPGFEFAIALSFILILSFNAKKNLRI